MMTERLVVDVSVVGAGPAGSAAAMVVARFGRSVLLISREQPRRPTIGESLPPKAKSVLDLLELASTVETDGHLPCYGNESAWGSSEISCTDFVVSPWGNGW